MSDSKSDLFNKIQSANIGDHLRIMCAEVEYLIRLVLECSEEFFIDHNQGFYDIGLDSITAVQIKDKLQNTFAGKIELRSEDIFDHPSIKKLSTFILSQLKIEWEDINTHPDESIEKEVSELTHTEVLKRLESVTKDEKW